MQVIERQLVDLVLMKRELGKPFVIFVTGPDAAGKSSFSKDYSRALNEVGLHTQIIHLDDFHNPKSIRYSSDSLPFDAYLNLSFDFEALVTNLLEPIRTDGRASVRLVHLDLGRDEFVNERDYQVTQDSVVLVEGVFLFQERLRSFCDLSIYLDVSLEESFRRGIARDQRILKEEVETRYLEKYVPAQAVHRLRFPPESYADIIIDNTRFEFPEVTIARKRPSLECIEGAPKPDSGWRCGGVVFDLWDTLVPLPEETKTMAQALTAQSLGLARNAFEEMWARTRRRRETMCLNAYLAEICEDLRIANPNRTIAEIIDIRKTYHGACFANPRREAILTLRSLRALGIPVAIVSNCTSDVPDMIARSGLGGIADYIVTSSDTGAMKPAAEIYRIAAARCNIHPQRCLYVGDGNDDELNGASRAGMRAVLLKTSASVEWPGLRIENLSEVIGLALYGGSAAPAEVLRESQGHV